MVSGRVNDCPGSDEREGRGRGGFDCWGKKLGLLLTLP